MTPPALPRVQGDLSPVFLIGSRFQAVMAGAIRDHLGLTGYDLVLYHYGDTQGLHGDLAVAGLARAAGSVTLIDRRRSTLAQCVALARAVGSRTRTVLIAQIAHPFVMATIRLMSRIDLMTFDEGSYNIDPDGPFVRQRRPGRRRPRDLIAGILLPDGPLAYAALRTKRHFTAFPPSLNLFAEKAERIALRWDRYADPAEAEIAGGVRSIAVLPCFKDFSGSAAMRERICAAAAGCDLVVRHPRDTDQTGIPSRRLNSPIEAIIDIARQHAHVTVYHYMSTVGLTLQDWTGVSVIDLSHPPDSPGGHLPVTPLP